MSKSRLKLALVAGGYSGEHEVSLRSQSGIASFLQVTPYDIYHLLITPQEWVALHGGERYPVDKNDFSVTLPDEGRVFFDYVYNTIHGTPGEDGLFTGYLDMLGIPYSCCPTAIGALTFDKYLCNRYLSTFEIPISPSVRLRDREEVDVERVLDELSLPLFVKPNMGGSSIATTRVDRADQLLEAVHRAFDEAPQVLVEQLIVGTEVTCGVYEDKRGIHVLPVTEVVPKNEFFDYDAKYHGAVEEITPARITEEMTNRIQELSCQIYGYLGASGIIRVDYIIQDGVPVLLEVNTTPGMTGTSFIPQQVRADGKTMEEVLVSIIDFHLEKHKKWTN
ncbi:MAG: D-alanine--D-alanine ligase [Porphyromonas sp.]|nr:D-alanine--D-alanine ligase [Porphyromonas sp.]